MDVFDSNVWVRAFTRSNHRAVNLRDDVKKGNMRVRVSPYIYQEVFDAFSGSHQKQAGSLKTAFAQFVENCNHVSGPHQRQVRRMSVHAVRNSAHMELIGEILDIQAKDAPIVVAAREFKGQFPTIYTCDKPFSQLKPQNHGLAWLDIDHVT